MKFGLVRKNLAAFTDKSGLASHLHNHSLGLGKVAFNDMPAGALEGFFGEFFPRSDHRYIVVEILLAGFALPPTDVVKKQLAVGCQQRAAAFEKSCFSASGK